MRSMASSISLSLTLPFNRSKLSVEKSIGSKSGISSTDILYSRSVPSSKDVTSIFG